MDDRNSRDPLSCNSTLGRLCHHSTPAHGQCSCRIFPGAKSRQCHRTPEKQFVPNAHTLPDNTWQDIPARELVPGDIIQIKLGDIVPADAKLSNGKYLLLDESALTGESFPVEKKSGDTVFSGSIVRQGEMDAKVTSTGGNTSFSKTAK